MPMVGRADRHDIDLFPREQITVVFETLRRAAETGYCLIADVAIDIANRDDIAVLLRLIGTDGPLIAEPNRANANPLELSGGFRSFLRAGGRMKQRRKQEARSGGNERITEKAAT